MTYSSGDLIANRFEVINILTGGMGIVYLCMDRVDDIPVALKTFKDEYLSDREARDNFLNEGNTWIVLGRHPNIVRAHHVINIGKGLEVYIVMDWVAKAENKYNASLRAWLALDEKNWTKLTPLSVEQTLLFALHIARGMKHAVTKAPSLIHRDLKPENILVGRDGLARITDFGLAKVLKIEDASKEATEDFTKTGERTNRMQVLPSGISGTPLYMAPEQWKPGEMLDARADIYSFGCIVYEMVNGELMVIGNNLKRLHCDGQAEKQAQKMKGEIGKLVRKCVAVDREERYESWMEVEEAVSSIFRKILFKDAPIEVSGEAETRADRVSAGWSYNAIGASYMAISKFQNAESYFERAKKIGEKESDRKLEFSGIGNLGIVYRALGDARRAIGLHERCLAMTREDMDRAGESDALDNLGNAYEALGNMKKAIELHEQSLTIAREIGNKQRGRKILGNLGISYASLGDFKRAIDYLEQELVLARETGDRVEEGGTLQNLGTVYYNLGNIQRAIEFHEQSLDIARKIGDRAGECGALFGLGNAYSEKGDSKQAIGCLEQSLNIMREIGDQRGESRALGSLGNAWFILGDPKKALEFYLLDITLARKIGDRAGEGETLVNVGRALFKLGDPRRAIEAYESSLRIMGDIGNIMATAVTSYNLARALIQQGRSSEALHHAEFAAKVFEQAGQKQNAQAAQQLIAQLRGGRN